MTKIVCLESHIKTDKSHYGHFMIEPLEVGQGITLGNALRRTLLSDLTGFAISGVRINDLKHEFAVVEGLREDVLEVLLNLKEIVFRTSFAAHHQDLKLKGFLHVQGPLIVTSGMFRLSKNHISLLNTNQYICTITDESEFYLEIDIEKGRGYRFAEDNYKRNMEEKLSPSRPSTLRIDSLFMPIKKVNYKIKLIHDTKGNIKESLLLEILTNGSISPNRSILEGLKLLMELLYPLFLTPDFLVTSSLLSKKFYKEKNE